ncbi:MAG: hypothetical protein EOO66_25745, partial [Methylobacterium sp.]
MDAVPRRDGNSGFLSLETPRPRLLLALFCLVLWLPGFFSLPPGDRDESRFAQATKQMLETGDFVRIQNGLEHDPGRDQPSEQETGHRVGALAPGGQESGGQGRGRRQSEDGQEEQVQARRSPMGVVAGAELAAEVAPHGVGKEFALRGQSDGNEPGGDGGQHQWHSPGGAKLTQPGPAPVGDAQGENGEGDDHEADRTLEEDARREGEPEQQRVAGAGGAGAEVGAGEDAHG